MYRIKIGIILIFTGFFISCGDEDLVLVGPGGVPLPNEDFSFFYLTIEDEEQHIFSVNLFNFQSVSTISFIIGFDSEVFTVSSSNVDINLDFSLTEGIGPYFTNSSIGFWYEFNGPVSGNGKLLTFDLDPIPGGEMEGTEIYFYFDQIIFLDDDFDYLYCNCSIPSYSEPEVCRDNGGFWGPNPDEISITSICYIDEGIINQFINNSSEPLENWEPTGNYIWSSILCQYE